MNRVFLLTCLLTSFSQLSAQSITYSLDLGNIDHHELRINIEYEDVNLDTLLLEIANTSPGRYAVHNFGKNVYGEIATDQKGKKIELIRASPLSWKVAPKKGYVKFSYTLFGNHADGTYAGIDAKRLHLNIPASFVFTKDLKELPIDLNLDVTSKSGWSVATQLQKVSETQYRAPNWYYFMDSPIMAGVMDFTSWEVEGQQIEVAMMHEGSTSAFNDYVDKIKLLVEEERKIFGELPQFDFGRYTFLCSYNPWVKGDGMEHRNSTICTSTGSLKSHGDRIIGTIAHEFFHAWNIERIRPKTLEPFKFDQGNVSGELWFGEGFTNYYDEIALTRSKVQSQQEYLDKLNRTLNYVTNLPGRELRNPIQMSQNATFTDAGVANDDTNYGNNFVSYYPYGEILGLGLDLLLRIEQDKNLDEFMRIIWNKYGKTEIPYDVEDLKAALADYTDKKFANEYFNNYIYDSKLPHFKSLFAEVGISHRLLNKGKVYATNEKFSDKNKVMSVTTKGGPLYVVGVDKGDIVLSIAGQKLSKELTYKKIVSTLEVGKNYEIEFEQMGVNKKGVFIAKQDPQIALTWMKESELSSEQVRQKARWLN